MIDIYNTTNMTAGMVFINTCLVIYIALKIKNLV